MTQQTAATWPSKRPHIAARIAAFKAEKARAEAKGLQILPSIRGPYAYDPAADRVLGIKGSDGYTAAVS